MAQHFTVERQRRMDHRIRSKVEGFRMRQPVYWCLQCDKPAGIERGTGARKAMYCNCGNKAQYFPSTGQLRCYNRLAMRRNAGEIANLILEPAFPIVINGIRVCVYRADFQFVEQGRTRIVDYKGNKDFTDHASALRRKLAEAMYGITIEIVEA